MRTLKKLHLCDNCKYLFATDYNEENICPRCGYKSKIVPSKAHKVEEIIEDVYLPNGSAVLYNLIGMGGYGAVFSILFNGNYYALKVPREFVSRMGIDEKKLERENRFIEKEIKFFKEKLKNTNIMVPIKDDGYIIRGRYKFRYFVQDLGYITLADLFDEIDVPPEYRYRFAKELISLIAKAHEKGILLGDISLDNIMIYISDDNELLIKLIDLGAAKDIYNFSHSAMVGKRVYLPQDLFQKNDTTRDVFNLSLVLYEILIGNPWIYTISNNDEYMYMFILDKYKQGSIWDNVINPNIANIPEHEEKKKFVDIFKRMFKHVNFFQDAQEMLNLFSEYEEIKFTIITHNNVYKTGLIINGDRISDDTIIEHENVIAIGGKRVVQINPSHLWKYEGNLWMLDVKAPNLNKAGFSLKIRVSLKRRKI